MLGLDTKSDVFVQKVQSTLRLKGTLNFFAKNDVFWYYSTNILSMKNTFWSKIDALISNFQVKFSNLQNTKYVLTDQESTARRAISYIENLNLSFRTWLRFKKFNSDS